MLIVLMAIFFGAQLAFANEVIDANTPENVNYRRLTKTKYILIPHRGTFVLPFVYNTMPHEDLYRSMKAFGSETGNIYKHAESEFQVSFLIPVATRVFSSNVDLNFGYTHHAWWQVYNSDWSRLFRETNYMPELFLRYVDLDLDKFLGFDFMGFDFGLIHESNGQIKILSRSWNRLAARVYLQNSGFAIHLSGWYRLPESREKDENPDIYRYRGYGELELNKSIGNHTFSYKTPLFAKHFSNAFKYSYPMTDRLRWFVSAELGYGHSLIEYNRKTQRFGAGLILDSLINDTQDTNTN